MNKNLFDHINRKGQGEYGYVSSDSFRMKLLNGKRIDHILDIGANIGLFTRYASELFPKAKILSLEPCEDTFQCLSQNIFDIKNAMPLNIGLGLNGFCSSKLNFKSPVASVAEPCPISEEKKVRSYDLESIFNFFSIKENYILKIDIEGCEKFLVDDPFSENAIANSELTCLEIHFIGETNKRNDFYKDYSFFNDWINKKFLKTHQIHYYGSSRFKGHGNYSMIKHENL